MRTSFWHILFWRSLVISFLILAFIGALLPGLPTTVFLILAAWAASKGWPALDHWLVNHPRFGHLIQDWRAHHTIPRRAKIIAILMMLVSGSLMWLTNAPFLVKLFTDTVMLIVAIWMWRQPEPQPQPSAVNQPNEPLPAPVDLNKKP